MTSERVSECATEGCGRTAVTYFEAGGVGSHYCQYCMDLITALRRSGGVAVRGGWRYDIQYGPEGEAVYAWVYDASGNMVCTAKIHHAKAIVEALSPAPKGEPEEATAKAIAWAAKSEHDVSADAEEFWANTADSHREVFLRMARAALAVALPPEPAPEGEPVAWQCFDCIMEQRSVIDDAELAAARSRRDSEWIVRPLYASPPPKAVIITDEMMEAGADAAADHFAIDGDAGPWLRPEGYAAVFLAMLNAAALSSEAHNGREVE